MKYLRWLGFALAFGSIAALGYLSCRHTRIVHEAVSLVSHSNAILYAVSDLLAATQTIEAGQHNFLITGREDFLRPYARALIKKKQATGRLRMLLVGDATAEAAINRLEQALDKLSSTAEEAIRSRRANGLDAASKALQEAPTDRIMDEVNTLLDGMEEAEAKRLVQRQLEAERSFPEALGTEVIITMIALLLLAAVIFAVTRYDARLERARHDLEEKVAQRTARLAQISAQAQLEKERCRLTLASIGDAVITTDLQGCITSVNKVAELLTGRTEHEAQGQPLAALLKTLNRDTHEPEETPAARCLREGKIIGPEHDMLLERPDSDDLIVSSSAAPIRDADDRIIGAILVVRDVSDHRRLTERLAYQASHDALTGLVNREEFERRLHRVLGSAGPQTPHALLYLDLDQFKVINDTCGHPAGDELIRQITVLLQARTRTRDTLARLGGDEFGVLLEHCTTADAQHIGDLIRQSVQDFAFCWQDQCFKVGVSIGLVALNQTQTSLAQVLSAADNACYAAKEAGRNRLHVYQDDDISLQQRQGEMQWLPKIRQALSENRFCLFYQAIVPLEPQREPVRYVEILLRLRDATGNIIAPTAFIPAAERYDHMLTIDQWVVSTALTELKQRLRHDPSLRFGINLSGLTLANEQFLDFLTAQLSHSAVPPQSLCFEITETAAISNFAHAIRFITEMKSRGCMFALDDFGSGLSSLAYLKSLPVDFIKIDGRFVKHILTSNVDQVMVQAIQSISEAMGLKSIAEAVESTASLALFRAMRIDYVQGYAFSEPQPIEHL